MHAHAQALVRPQSRLPWHRDYNKTKMPPCHPGGSPHRYSKVGCVCYGVSELTYCMECGMHHVAFSDSCLALNLTDFGGQSIDPYSFKMTILVWQEVAN